MARLKCSSLSGRNTHSPALVFFPSNRFLARPVWCVSVDRSTKSSVGQTRRETLGRGRVLQLAALGRDLRCRYTKKQTCHKLAHREKFCRPARLSCQSSTIAKQNVQGDTTHNKNRFVATCTSVHATAMDTNFAESLHCTPSHSRRSQGKNRKQHGHMTRDENRGK